MSAMLKNHRIAAGVTLAGTVLLVSACGGGSEDAAANNSSGLATAAPGNFTIGNDASAMETVGSANTAIDANLMQIGNMTGSAGGAGVNSANPAEGGAGNQVQTNAAGR